MMIMMLVMIIMMIMVTMMHDHGDYDAGDDYYLNFTKDGFPSVKMLILQLVSSGFNDLLSLG